MLALILLTILPLLVILLQKSAGLENAADFWLYNYLLYSVYKLSFIVPPLIYCRVHKIGIFSDILKPRNWRRGLKEALVLGVLAIGLFWGAYALLGKMLVNEDEIVAKINEQFSTNARTILLIAPFTIIVNSLLEEFFYRGFAFGLLVKKNTAVAYLLPAVVFSLQHVLFFHDWFGWIPLVIATAGLAVFALALAWLYARADTIAAPWITHICGDIAMMGIAVMLLF